MQNSVAKKIFAVGVAASTMLLGFAPSAFAAAHAAGTNVKSSDGTIWMVTASNTRRAYTSGGAFLSYGFNSFASVVDANADDLALPVDAAGFIPPQDGSIFCATATKASDVAGECALVTGGMKASFTSASVFTGQGFSFARAQYGDSSFLNKTSNVDNAAAMHLAGVLVNKAGTVYLVGTSGLLGIPDLATFNSWGYSFANVVPANAADTGTQTGVMAARMPGQLSPTSLANPGNPVVSGSVSAMLASDTPASGTIVASSSSTTLAKFAFTGTGTVTSVNLKRVGVSADTVLSNVYLFDGATRLTDAASVGGQSMINFTNANGLFTVSGTKVVSVVVEVAGNASSGQTVGVQLTGFAVASGTPATVALSGNLMTVSSVSDLASVDFGTATPSNASLDPAADVEVFRSQVSVGTRDVTLSRLALRQIGSVNTGDIVNLRLRIDGTQVAQVQNLSSDGYANFSFSPITLKSGTRIFNVLADVIGGSSRNFQFSIRNKADVNFMDTNYGVGISPTYASGAFPVVQATANSLNAGELTFAKATDSPSSDVTTNSSDVTLAKYTVTAYGEAMKIETLGAGATSSDQSVGSLRNGRILINGVQYGSTSSLARCTGASTCTGGGTSYTLNYTVTPGSPVTLEIHADIYDNDGTNNLTDSDTLAAFVKAGSSNVQRMVSLGYVGRPSTGVAGNTINVVTGSMSVSKNNTYSGQTIPLPQTGFKIAAFNLTGSSSEDITVSSVDLSVAASGTFSYDELNNVQVKIGGNLFGTVKSTLSSGTSSFSGNYALVKNSTVAVEVWADLNLGNAVAADTITPTIFVNGTTVSSSATVGAGTSGQVITYNTGSLTITKDASSPNAALVADQQTRTVGAFKFQSVNDSFTLKEITVAFGGSVTTVNNVILKDGGSVIGTKPAAGSSVVFSSLNISIPNNSTKVLTVDLELGTVGNGAGTSNETVTVNLSSIKYTNSTGTQTTDTSSVPTGNATYVHAAIPTITNVTLPSGSLSTGTQTLSKITISSGGTGTIAWNKLIFNVDKSVGPALDNFAVYDADTNTQITGTVATSTLMATSTIAASGTVTFTVTQNGGQEELTSRTYVLKATVTGTLSSGQYVNTSIAAGQSAHQAAATSTAVPQTETFVWSDESATSHATTTTDWFGDFLVKNIPTDAQSLVK